eukprot:UN01730
MSKVSTETLQEAIAAILKDAKEVNKRKFTQTIELQFGLKNYDPNKEKRFSGQIVLPHIPRTKFTVCVIGTEDNVAASKAVGGGGMTQDDLKLLNKDKKKVKKLAASYNSFLASASLIRQIPRLLGPGLSKAGKFPSVINTNDSVAEKIEEQKATVKFTLKSKRSLCLAVAVANVEMTPEQIQENVVIALNFFASLLPKNWQQIKRVHLHSTMGKSYKIFGM